MKRGRSVKSKIKAGRGKINVLTTKNRDGYTAHCLDFDLIGEGKTLKEAFDNLSDVIFTYVHFAVKNDLEIFMYNPAPKRYWNMLARKKKKLAHQVPSIPPEIVSAPKNRLKDYMYSVDSSGTPVHV
jgi:predicted RNase H-like HicB family nuclease